MKSQKQRMLAGELYDASDPQLAGERRRARALCHAINALPVGATDETATQTASEKARLLSALFGRQVLATITPPFYCDYGHNIVLGRNVYFNYDCVILDVCQVSIGNDTMFGPGVHIYTATHPMSATVRRSGLELGAPVVIEDDVWVGGKTIVCPGVTIGARSVIGAGSVVTNDIPQAVLAAGNPCRVIRPLDDEAGDRHRP